MVYPGEMAVSVNNASQTVEQAVCSNLTATDTSCTASLPRGVYNVTLTQTNEIGSTVDYLMVDSELVHMHMNLTVPGLCLCLC